MQIIKRFTNGKFKLMGDHRISQSKTIDDITVTRTVVLPQFISEAIEVDYIVENDNSLTIIVDAQLAVDTMKKIMKKISQNENLIDEAIRELQDMA